jgi:putative FmdB family regulatory protein
MPTYEFRCPLGHEFEKFYRSIGTAESKAGCPECGQLAERMMSAGAGLVFKGSGFYLTDYGKNAHQKKGPSDGKSNERGESVKSDGGGESSKVESSSSGGDSSGATSADSAKSDAKKSEAKPAESKPAATPPKSSSSE